jgi:outer membrane murein-binding lipoprotein Lpp
MSLLSIATTYATTTSARESHRVVLAAAALAAVAGCGGSSSSGEVTEAFRDGIAAIRGTQDFEQLRTKLQRTIARLRSTDDGRGRRLAIRGFAATLSGVQFRIDFHENDRGNISAATLDARRANAELTKGAKLLRRAGRLLDVPVGTLAGY